MEVSAAMFTLRTLKMLPIYTSDYAAADNDSEHVQEFNDVREQFIESDVSSRDNVHGT